jgi:hypothetical protein
MAVGPWLLAKTKDSTHKSEGYFPPPPAMFSKVARIGKPPAVERGLAAESWREDMSVLSEETDVA